MKYLFGFLFLLVLLPIIPAFASPLDVNIPPTPAFTSISTSNSTVYAKNYSTPLHFVGIGGITIKGDNMTKTVYINGTSIAYKASAVIEQVQ